MNRNVAYDYRLKIDAINGFIPKEFKKVINPYHVYRWRKIKFNKIIGFNYYNNQETNLHILNKQINDLQEALHETLAKFELLNLVNNHISQHNEYNSLIRKYKKEISDCLEKKRKVVGIQKLVKLLNIDFSTYLLWRQELRAKCNLSSNFICAKKHPTKLTSEEESKIIELLKDPRFAHYPLTALIWKAHHEGIVHACDDTWRKLQQQQKIVRFKPKRNRKKHYKSLKAEYVNQYLHADITYFKLLSGKTYYIYLVKDNFSKYIKSWAVSDSISGKTRVKTFEDALRDINTETHEEVNFITDQGVENRSKDVLDFCNSKEKVKISFARRDIPFSNSMIERFNSDLKYLYLYKENIYTLKQLNASLKMAIDEHNQVKRLDCLNGQTPYEVYTGVPLKNSLIKENWNKAKENRKQKIKSTICCIEEKLIK